MRVAQFFPKLSLIVGTFTLFGAAAPPTCASAPHLTLSPSSPVLIEGQSLDFQAFVGSELENKTTEVSSWTSSNPAVATVDSTGRAIALSAGTTTITAVFGNKQGTTPLTVISVSRPIFSVQPSVTLVGAAMTPPVEVLIQDNSGLAIAGMTVTIGIGTNGGQGGTGILNGTLSQVTDSNGTASFADLSLDWLGTGYTLTATVATPTGPLTTSSVAFDVTRAGDACLGPNPPCSSGCADTDGDGLSDSWETAGGVDLNGDGVITDNIHDLILPGADPHKPDVYVKYDYMVATTTSPLGTPPHSHQPPAAAIQQVVDAFAAHGVTLHVDPEHDAIPEVQVTTLDPDPKTSCAGKDFVTMKTLREQHLGNRKWAYRYGVFAHNAVLPDTAPDGSACPADPECGGFPDPANSGISELPGSSFIVALGYLVDLGLSPGVELQAGTFMHELGHNFGLKHGSLGAPAPSTCLAFKPNYVSIMDYLYQGGIVTAAEAGTTTPVNCTTDSECPMGSHCTDDLADWGGNICYRIDYSRERLLDLDEANLDETIGVGGPASDADVISYCARGLGCGLAGPSNGGTVDWNNDGLIEASAQGDIDGDNGMADHTLVTGDDWDVSGSSFANFNFNFQCTTAFAANAGGGSPACQSSLSTNELSLKYALEHHILHPPANASVVRVCSSTTQLRTPGAVQLALLGSAHLDIQKVDRESLNVRGAHPFRISVVDFNHDGIPDLLLEFRGSEIGLQERASRMHLIGWLKNSRAFVGNTQPFPGCSE